MLQGPKGDVPSGSGYYQNTLDSDHTITIASQRKTGPKGEISQSVEETITDSKGKVVFNGRTTTVQNDKSKDPQEITVRSDGRKQAIRMPKPHTSITEPRHLSLEMPSNWSLSLGAHYGRRHFKNSEVLDHNTFGARLGFGIRLNFGKLLEHKLLPKVFYDFAFAQNTIVGPIKSQAQLHSFGAEVGYLYETVGNWLYLGGAAAIGATLARSKEGRFGVEGVQFNDNNLLSPVNEAGLHVELGPRLCTWGMRLCMDAKVVSDLSLDPEIGNGLREGLSATGINLGLSVDIMQFFSKPSPKGYLQNHSPKIKSSKGTGPQANPAK